MNKIFILLIPILIFISSSCNRYNNEVYIEYYNFNNDIWLDNEIVVFKTDMVIESGSYVVMLNINHRFNYSFKNLTVAYEIINNDSLIYINSKKIDFLDSKDIWTGKRIFSNIQISKSLMDTLKLVDEKNNLKIRVSSLIDEKELKGISRVGIQISKIENN